VQPPRRCRVSCLALSLQPPAATTPCSDARLAARQGGPVQQAAHVPGAAAASRRELCHSHRRCPLLQGWLVHALVVLCFSGCHVLMFVSYVACSGVPEASMHQEYTRSRMWQCPDQAGARLYAEARAMPVPASRPQHGTRPGAPTWPCHNSMPEQQQKHDNLRQALPGTSITRTARRMPAAAARCGPPHSSCSWHTHPRHQHRPLNCDCCACAGNGRAVALAPDGPLLLPGRPHAACLVAPGGGAVIGQCITLLAAHHTLLPPGA